VVVLVAVLVVGSLVEVHAQSSDFRTSTDTGYAQLASRVVDASNRTGPELATLMNKASQLTDGTFPHTARAELQQGLDDAVASTSEQASQAVGLVPPYPSGTVSAQFTRVMTERATATLHLRSSVDQLLGMTPLPVAGSPTTTAPPQPAPLASVDTVSSALGAVGSLFQQADGAYRNLEAYIRRERVPVYLPRSVWVPAPTATAPLGATQLGAAAPALSGSPALAPTHELVITAVGLSPAAVASGGAGVVGVGCGGRAQSVIPGPAPTVLPPTGTVTASLTLTNCGNVLESGVVVAQTLSLADPAGTALPRAGARGTRSQTRVAALAAGSSIALTMPSVSVAGGHLYLLAVAVNVLPDQTDRVGTTQEFLLQISG
jgi:hypothetical protein